MDLTPYVDRLQEDLEAAAAAGTDETRQLATRLTGALDASVRLCLVDALSAMAAEVTATGDAGTVEIRMHGRDPEIVVLPVAAEPEPAPQPTAAPEPAPDDEDDRGTARITLRLPEGLKSQAEQRATAEGLSTNAWLVRAVSDALGAAGFSLPGRGSRPGRRITGFARS